MSLQKQARAIIDALTTRGLSFSQFTTHDGLSVMHPTRWRPEWRRDHVSIFHGEPASGWLTLFPAIIDEPISPKALLLAFLDEFVEEVGDRYELLELGQSDRHPALESAHFAILDGDTRYLGMATAWLGSGQGRIASYWITETLFQRTLVGDLLLAVLGSVETTEDSRFAERRNHPTPLSSQDLWNPAPLDLDTPFGAPTHRFALRLPAGWQALEVVHEEDRGWLLVPPNKSPGQDGVPVIVVDGDDLDGTLEETLHGAIHRLSGEGGYELEVPPQSLEVQDQPAFVQLWRGQAPAAADLALRLWSLGIGSNQSVVHMVAIGDAQQLESLLPTLAAIGNSIRVLPRVTDPAKMEAMAGSWRYLQKTGKESETIETRIELERQGGFKRVTRSIDPQVVQPPVKLDSEGSSLDAGRWDIVHDLLTLYLADGGRECHPIETIADGMALLNKTIWQRIEP